MKISQYTFLFRRSKLVCACAFLLFGAHEAGAQTSIYTASYTSAGSTAQTGGTFTLNTFTVTAVYTGNSATNESVFITDGTANGRIFGSQTTLAGLTPGVQATATITTSVYQGTEEFTTATGITPATTTGSFTPGMLSLAQVQSTAAFTTSPGDGTGLYPTEGSSLLAPVTFTITPNASGTLSTTTATTLTDTSTSDAVISYRAATAIAYTAGTTYKVVGIEQPFNGDSEIVGITSMTPLATAPEPSTIMLLGIGGVTLMVFVRRMRSAKLG